MDTTAEDVVLCPVCEKPCSYMQGWCHECGTTIPAELRPEPDEIRPDPDPA